MPETSEASKNSSADRSNDCGSNSAASESLLQEFWQSQSYQKITQTDQRVEEHGFPAMTIDCNESSALMPENEDIYRVFMPFIKN